MAKRESKKRGGGVSVRSATAWIAAGGAALTVAVIGLTAWFVLATLGEDYSVQQSPSQKPATAKTINAELLNDLSGRISAKTGRPITDLTGARNPFRLTSPAAPAELNEPEQDTGATAEYAE